jgi:hypothetical protein
MRLVVLGVVLHIIMRSNAALSTKHGLSLHLTLLPMYFDVLITRLLCLDP